MSEVVAIIVDGTVVQPVLDVAAAVASVAGAVVRRVDVTADASADRILTALADAPTVVGVLSTDWLARDPGWRLMQSVHRPVVLVPADGPGRRRMISRALVPLDGTPESAAAVAQTVALLARAGVDLVILHVFDASTVPKYWNHSAHAHQAWQTEFLARFCEPSGVRLELRSGQAGEHVLDVAAAERVDLIALGWSQHLGAGRARTVRSTVQQATVPVMLVPMATDPV